MRWAGLTGPLMILQSWARWPPRRGFARDMRRWPGASMSTITATRGKSSAVRIMPISGFIVDSFHTLARGIDPDSLRRVPGDKIFFMQLADAPRIDMDLLYWSGHFRNMPGEGDLDVAAFTRAVMATGYAGPISLEIFNDQFRGG